MVIYGVSEQDRPEPERLRRKLFGLGFRPLATATWISPHERLDDVARALPDTTARVELLTCRSRDRATDLDMVERSRDLKALGRDYQDFVSNLRAPPVLSDLATTSVPTTATSGSGTPTCRRSRFRRTGPATRRRISSSRRTRLSRSRRPTRS